MTVTVVDVLIGSALVELKLKFVAFSPDKVNVQLPTSNVLVSFTVLVTGESDVAEKESDSLLADALTAGSVYAPVLGVYL